VDARDARRIGRRDLKLGGVTGHVDVFD